jgi:glutamate--cysteine ligase
VPRTGINTRWQAGTLRDLARAAIAIARDGLLARNRRDAGGMTEAAYLEPLEAIAAGASTQAEHWLERYDGVWAGDVGRIFPEARV